MHPHPMRPHPTPDAPPPRRSVPRGQRGWFKGSLFQGSLFQGSLFNWAALGISLGMGWIGLGGVMPGAGLAQDESPTAPVPATQLEQDFALLRDFPAAGQLNSTFFEQVDPKSLIDEKSVSDTTLTLPSLWWSRDQVAPQLGGYRLVRAWLAYRIAAPDLRVVDLAISSQYWTVLNYPERYAILNQFGTAAKQFGYNLRVFQGNYLSSRLVGLYVCDFTAGATPTPSLAPSADSLPINENENATESTPAHIPCQASLDLFSLEGYRGSENNSPFMGTADETP